MCKICLRFTRFYLFLECAIYAQGLLKIVLISSMHNIWQDLRWIVLISPMSNICRRFPLECIYFSNAQYMCKICISLYLFLQCAIYVQDLRKIVLIFLMCKICARFAKLYLILQCAIYVQDLREIVLLSSMSNICSVFEQYCTYSSYAQYMGKI